MMIDPPGKKAFFRTCRLHSTQQKRHPRPYPVMYHADDVFSSLAEKKHSKKGMSPRLFSTGL